MEAASSMKFLHQRQCAHKEPHSATSLFLHEENACLAPSVIFRVTLSNSASKPIQTIPSTSTVVFLVTWKKNVTKYMIFLLDTKIVSITNPMLIVFFIAGESRHWVTYYSRAIQQAFWLTTVHISHHGLSTQMWRTTWLVVWIFSHTTLHKSLMWLSYQTTPPLLPHTLKIYTSHSINSKKCFLLSRFFF